MAFQFACSGLPARATTLLLTVVVVVSLVACAPAQVEPEGHQEVITNQDGATITKVNDAVTIVHLRGTAAELGTQHGTMLADSINAYLDGFVIPYVETKGGREMFDLAAEMLHEHFSASEKAELAAVADASGRSLKDILLLNTYLEVANALAGREGQRYPFSGSAMASDPANVRQKYTRGGLIGGSVEVALFNENVRPEPFVFCIHPERGKPFITVAMPGQIGAMSGSNFDGLSFFTTQVPGPLGLKPAVPFHMLCRRMLASTGTAEAAAGFVVESSVSTSHNLLLADATDHVWAVECSAERIAIRKNEPRRELGEHVLWCANHFEDPGMASQQVAPSVASLERSNIMKGSVAALGEYYFRHDTFAKAIADASRSRDVVAGVVFQPHTGTLRMSVVSDPDQRRPFHKITRDMTYGVLAPELVREAESKASPEPSVAR